MTRKINVPSFYILSYTCVLFDFQCTLLVHRYLCNDQNEEPNQGKLKQAMTKQIKCSN
jgi:hypothetical protein